MIMVAVAMTATNGNNPTGKTLRKVTVSMMTTMTTPPTPKCSQMLGHTTRQQKTGLPVASRRKQLQRKQTVNCVHEEGRKGSEVCEATLCLKNGATARHLFQSFWLKTKCGLLGAELVCGWRSCCKPHIVEMNMCQCPLSCTCSRSLIAVEVNV